MNSDSECTYGSMQLEEVPRIIPSTAMACTSAPPVRTSCAPVPSPPNFSILPAISATKRFLSTTAGGPGRIPSSIARNYKQVPFPLFRFPQICLRSCLHLRPHHAQCWNLVHRMRVQQGCLHADPWWGLDQNGSPDDLRQRNRHCGQVWSYLDPRLGVRIDQDQSHKRRRKVFWKFVIFN